MADNFFAKYLNSKNIIFAFVMFLFLFFIINCKDIAIMFFASFVIACSLNPVVDKLEEKIPRTLAAVIVIFLITFLFAIIFIHVFISSTEQIKTFLYKLPHYIDNVDEYVFSLPVVKNFSFLSGDVDNIMEQISLSSGDVIQKIVDIGKNISSAFIYLIVSVIIVFNVIVDKNKIKDFYLHLFPREMRPKAQEVGKIISNKMGGYLIALVLTTLSVGVVMAIGLTILKVPYAMLLALITAVFDIVPVIGPLIALIVCIIATYEAFIGAIISVVVVFAISQLIENNFVRPYVFSKFLHLHPLVIFLFLFLAAQYMGLIGVIFAPALAAITAVLFEELYLKKID